MASSSVSPPPSSSAAAWTATVGMLVTVETSSGTSVSGRVYACDLATNTLVLERAATAAGPGGKKATSDFDIFKIQHLVAVHPAVDPAGEGGDARVSAPGPVNVSRLEARENQRLSAAAHALDRIGVGVTPEAQTCFNLLVKTLPCRWKATTIVVMEGEVTVEAPYTADAAQGRNASSLAHVRKIVRAFTHGPGRGVSHPQ